MLPKRHRLPLRTELKRVQKNGRLYQGKLFSLLVCQQINDSPSRFAFIISTKIHKKAVERNRIRRLLTEAIRGNLANVKPGNEAVFLVKKAILKKQFKEVEEEVERLFGRAGVSR